MKRVADTLITPRMVLRQPRADDLPVYTAYCASDRTRFVRGPFTEAQAFDKFAAMIGHWSLRGFGRWVMEFNGEPVGHAGPLQSEAGCPPELTWTLWLGAHEGKGLASEAARAAARHLLTDCGWPLLLIRIDPDNAASLRVAEKLGARPADRPAPDWYPGALTFDLAGAA